MDLKEVASFLGWKREYVLQAIEAGVSLPKSKEKKYLKAIKNGSFYDVDDESLDKFIGAFEQEEPGRHPFVAVRRELLVEASHRCAVCEQPAPLQYHHIIEFSVLKHHDPEHMLAVCGTDHDKMTLGHISTTEQRMYKDRLKKKIIVRELGLTEDDLFPVEISKYDLTWYVVRQVIEALHENLAPENGSGISQFDFDDVKLVNKNSINRMGANYFAMMQDHHEPYFGIIRDFLANPLNTSVATRYHEIVDEVRTLIATEENNFISFEEVLVRILQSAKGDHFLIENRRSFNILLSFMYFHCDIGKKK